MLREAQDLDVMSFNIRGWSKKKDDGINAWVNRARFNTETIYWHGPHIVGLQEFDLAMNAPDYDRYLLDYERVNGPECVPDRYNPTLFDRSRLALITQGGFWLSDTPDEKSVGWGASEERAVTLALFRDLQSGKAVLHVNTHFEVRGEQARVESSKLILQRTERYRRNRIPIVITADLNSSHYVPDNATYTSTPHDLLTHSGFTDAYLDANPESIIPPRTFHGYQGDKFEGDEYGSWMMDHILHMGFRQRNFRVLRDSRVREPKYPSDHYPITAQLAFAA